MDITNSSLWYEVDKIIASGEKPVHSTWDLTIYANSLQIAPFKVLSIDFEHDFLHNYTDLILVSLALPLGTFIKKVYPYLDNLDIELIRQDIGETNGNVNAGAVTQVERYTATMVDVGNPIIQSNIGRISSEEDLNRIDIPTLTFQLTNKSIEQIRLIPVGGIYRNMTGENLIKALMTKESQTANVSADRKLKGVQMVKASNQKVRETLIIPQNVPLVDIPHHVHYHCGGIYSSGLGYYLFKDHWYIFPAYDNTRFSDGDPTLTIVNIPKQLLPGIERTYRKDGDNLVIIATGDTSFKELSNIAQLNDGNGVRFADASKMMDKFVVTKDNKAIASRAKTNTEMVGEERANKLNYVTTALRKINANPFVEFSDLAARQGSGVSVVWENSNRSLLYPGMPVKYQYLDGNDVKELFGVLLGAHEFVSLREPGPTATRYTSSTTLNIFVKSITSVTAIG